MSGSQPRRLTNAQRVARGVGVGLALSHWERGSGQGKWGPPGPRPRFDDICPVVPVAVKRAAMELNPGETRDRENCRCRSQKRHPCGDTTAHRQGEKHARRWQELGLFITGHKASRPLLPPETVAASRILFVSSPGQASSGEGQGDAISSDFQCHRRPFALAAVCRILGLGVCLTKGARPARAMTREKGCISSNPGKLAHMMCQEGVSIS